MNFATLYRVILLIASVYLITVSTETWLIVLLSISALVSLITLIVGFVKK
ncbi:hypothetical protein [Paenibacillus sp. MMS18-CY102]|nr:hypothetical protein [Paenibacillus sp. MMS18-CY102]MWC27671.1 hypothetical protein [Paenibacillus sp. MMS18-CY102]